MKITANAKINLALDVLGKRDDGYHEVSMIMQEIDLCDTLDIETDTSGEVRLFCDSFNTNEIKNTLTYRAARMFLDEINSSLGCTIRLTQQIPMCSGLGGGSADAAAVLRALNELCGTPCDTDALAKIGLSLGADVPFCVTGGTAVAKGIGEKLCPIDGIKRKWVALIKPKIDISTAEAYHKMDEEYYPHPDIEAAAEFIKKGDMQIFYTLAGNAFEYVTKSIHPEIEQIKKYLLGAGAEFAMMSGSGPTVYGLFEKECDAKKAFEAYRGSYSGGGIAQFVIKD